MAWQTEIVTIVRHMINDIDAAVYNDERIQETIIVSTTLLLPRVDFSHDYSADVDLLSLSPDPTQVTPKDNDFIRLVSLQTASFILNCEVKTMALQAIKIVDGPSTVDVTGAYKALKELADKYQKDLDAAVMDYQAGNSVGAGAVMTPYTVDSVAFGTRIRNYYY
jgi:hypothetical protein